MGALFTKINRLQFGNNKSDNDNNKHETIEQLKSTTDQYLDVQRTPCTVVPKHLLDPRSVSSGIQRTPIIVLHEVEVADEVTINTPIQTLPYLETDLDASACTIRTSTPVASASPMKDLLQSSPVLAKIKLCYELVNASLQEDAFSLHSDEEDGLEQLFNNERMLFESEDQGSFEEDEAKQTQPENVEIPKETANLINKAEIMYLSDDHCEIDHEVREIFSISANGDDTPLAEHTFSEEECLFTDTSSVQNSGMINSISSKVVRPVLDNHLVKTKNGRTPLGNVSSNPPCSPNMNYNNLISINKDTEVTKPWRNLHEERLSRGLLGVENTPPPASLPTPELIQSAPGKLLTNRGRNGKAAWTRDNSLII